MIRLRGAFNTRGNGILCMGDTVTETQKAMNELRYKLEHGAFVEKKKVVLSEWFITWMEQYKKNRVKAGTYYNYKKYFDSMIKGRLGDKKVSDIRGEHIQRFYNDLEKAGYALSSIKIVSAILNGCMQQAVRNGLIERNPVKLAELAAAERGKGARQAMTKEQQGAFHGICKGQLFIQSVCCYAANWHGETGK